MSEGRTIKLVLFDIECTIEAPEEARAELAAFARDYEAAYRQSGAPTYLIMPATWKLTWRKVEPLQSEDGEG